MTFDISISGDSSIAFSAVDVRMRNVILNLGKTFRTGNITYSVGKGKKGELQHMQYEPFKMPISIY